MKKGFNFDMASVADSSFIGSDEPVTEYGFALRRYLLDAETMPKNEKLSMRSGGSSRASISSTRSAQGASIHYEEDQNKAPITESASAKGRQRKRSDTLKVYSREGSFRGSLRSRPKSRVDHEENKEGAASSESSLSMRDRQSNTFKHRDQVDNQSVVGLPEPKPHRLYIRKFP